MFAFLSSRGGSSDSVEDALRDNGELETVVVLAQDVDFGATITADMLTTKAIPSGSVLTGAIEEPEEVVGKVATTRLFMGEQVIAGKVTTFGEQPSLAFKVPEGLRALSLMVPHEAWAGAGLPQPGDRVDVLGVTALVIVDPLTGQERPELTSGIIAQDVQVLASAQTVVRTVSDPTLGGDTTTGATGEDDEGTSGNSSAPNSDGTANTDTVNYRPLDDVQTFETAISITLAVTPEQAALIAIIDAMKDDEGQYRVLTRRQGERGAVDGAVTWTLDDVFTLN